MKKFLLYFKFILVIIITNYSVLKAQDWNQVIKAVASDRAVDDAFGSRVSISGDYAIVGAYLEDEDAGGGNTLSAAGSAYIFKRDGLNNWSQIEKIVASDRAANDNFGITVSISGDYAIIGAEAEDEDASGANTLLAAGSAYIFKNDGSDNWTQIDKIVASDRAAADYFGCSVAISEDYAIVGAYSENDDANGENPLSFAGSAYIFKNDGSDNWTQIEKIVASDRAEQDYFGYNSVSISGDYAIVGAYREDEDANGGNTIALAGSAYIFKNDGLDNWTQIEKIVASDRAETDYFGYSVSISGNYALVGAYLEEEDASGANTLPAAGSAYIFKNDGSDNWTQIEKIVASDRAASDYFGYSVSISGNYAVVGAYREDEDASGGNTLSNAGSAYFFKNDGSDNWTQIEKIVASDRAAADYFGYNVSISGDYAIVGANWEDEDANGGNTLDKAGSVYFCRDSKTIYVKYDASGDNNGTSWTNAYTSLQSALDAAFSGDEIWVTSGTYKPSTEVGGTGTRFQAFQMIDGVEIYGGFAGTETAVSQRTDYGYGETNETVLSGDFNDDDVVSGSGSSLGISNKSENAYHVFRHPSGYTLTSSARLDGFTITGSYANESGDAVNDGGGIYNAGSGQSQTINNCTFFGNTAKDQGGAIYLSDNNDVTITNCSFIKNEVAPGSEGVDGQGGALCIYNSTPSITNCLFQGNQADNDGSDLGGAMINYGSNSSITNCTFVDNYSYSGGGIYNNDNSNPTITNCIISEQLT